MSTTSKRLKVLFVYDDETIETLVKEKWLIEHDVDLTFDYFSAQKLLLKNQYELLIFDYYLGGKKLADVARTSNKNIPILVLDTVGTQAMADEINGHNLKFLTVPFTDSGLKEKIKELIK